MKTFKIDDTMEDFELLRGLLDREVEIFRQQRKMHSLGVIEYFDNEDLQKTEYLYSFSNEDQKIDDVLNVAGGPVVTIPRPPSTPIGGDSFVVATYEWIDGFDYDVILPLPATGYNVQFRVQYVNEPTWPPGVWSVWYNEVISGNRVRRRRTLSGDKYAIVEVVVLGITYRTEVFPP